MLAGALSTSLLPRHRCTLHLAPHFPSTIATYTVFVQPPLPANRGDDGDNPFSVVGTDQWVSILFGMKGKAQVVWYTPDGKNTEEAQNGGVQSGEYADGVGFPKLKPWRMGIYVINLLLDVPEGQPVVEDKKSI